MQFLKPICCSLLSLCSLLLIFKQLWGHLLELNSKHLA